MNATPTLSDFLETTYVRSHEISEATADQMRVAVRAFRQWAGRNLRVIELTEPLVRDFLVDFAANHAAATTNSRRRDLLAIWQAAADEDLLPPPNRKRVPRRREPKRIPDAWTTAELARLVKYLDGLGGLVGEIPAGPFWKSLVLAVYATGCRISALRSTLSAECNLRERWIIVRAENQKTNEDRLYRLTEDATRSIASHYSTRRELVWPWPFTPKHLWASFRKHVDAAGLRSSRRRMSLFHMIRRSHGSYLAAEAGLEAARRSLGHSDARLTLASYIDPRVAGDQTVVDALPSLNT